MGKTHVLHVVGEMNYGGTEAFLMNLLRSVDREKYQFDFVEQTPKSCAYDAEILALGSRIYRCPHISLTSLGAYRKWWRDFFAEHLEYQIIHGHSRGSAPIYMDEAHRADRIVIAHCHSSSYGLGLSGLKRRLWQLPLKKLGDYNFACSTDAGISQYGKHSTFQVINNGVITSRFAWNNQFRKEIREQYQVKDDEFLVGNVARFETPKNHAFLVNIFSELIEKKPNAKLLLVGTGSLEKQLRGQIEEKGIMEHVIFAGSRTDVYKYYQAMDAFVLPSHYEGLPLVMIEAQTAGLPCFTSAKVVAPECRITELVQFIPLEYPSEKWAEIILQTVSAQPQRKDHSQEVRNAGFDIEDTAKYLCDFYRKALMDRGRISTDPAFDSHADL